MGFVSGFGKGFTCAYVYRLTEADMRLVTWNMDVSRMTAVACLEKGSLSFVM